MTSHQERHESPPEWSLSTRSFLHHNYTQQLKQAPFCHTPLNNIQLTNSYHVYNVNNSCAVCHTQEHQSVLKFHTNLFQSKVCLWTWIHTQTVFTLQSIIFIFTVIPITFESTSENDFAFIFLFIISLKLNTEFCLACGWNSKRVTTDHLHIPSHLVFSEIHWISVPFVHQNVAAWPS